MQKFVDLAGVREAIRRVCADAGLDAVNIDIHDVTKRDAPRVIEIQIVDQRHGADPTEEPPWQNN